MHRKQHTLRSRIVWAFAGFAIVVAVVFGLSTTVFLYTVEDQFFDALLSEEAALLESAPVPHGAWGAPRHGWMSVHASVATMPADLAPQLLVEADRREFRGDNGRHYHLRVLQRDSIPSAWLVAEVSDRLVVRPMRTALLEQWLYVELLILLLALALALLIAQRIARPLSVLAASVRDLDPASPSPAIAIVGADREVALVARALEDMRHRVASFVQREQAFTRDASHELRTPLSVIRSTTSQALQDPTLPATTQRLLSLALQSAENMERSVASLLALSREGADALPVSPCRVLPVLEDVVLELSTALDARQLALRIQVPPDAALPVNAAVLHLLLANLINNAVVHASHGPVCVTFEHAQLTVTNPVLPDVLPAVERLGAPGTKSKSSPGFGYGLSIVQRLCDQAGLQVHWYASDHRFSVRFGVTGHQSADKISIPALQR